MTLPIRFLIVVTTLAFALISSCSQAPEQRAPRFTGRLLFLNGQSASGRELTEFTPDGETYKLTTIASDVFEATASMDQSQILYATKDRIALRDLHSGSSKSLIKDGGFCLAWAPDAKHFSFTQRSSNGVTLYVADLEGRTQRISEEVNAGAQTDAPEKPATFCAQWIAPDRLVYDQVSGEILKSTAVKDSVKPNTTTVATVGGAVLKGVVFERKWSIQGVCSSGSAILTPADQSQPILIAKTTERFDTVNPTPGPSEGKFIGFAAKSCVPFFISQSLSTTTDLFSLNPANWQRLRTSSIQQTFSPSAKFLIKSSAKLMIAGDAPDKLLLINTESGDVTPLVGSGDKKLMSPVPIVWIEN